MNVWYKPRLQSVDNIVREAMLKMSATECIKLLYKNEPLGKRIVAAAKIIFGR